ncbi:MAG TPA: hypothetical protein VNT75_05135 [Symbiobacteriaceae bacterium]|nr:hypothetical protein [Symbiobacteriaceae bacterium]
MEQTQANLPLEIIAAITAAVAVYLDKPVDQFVLRSVSAEGAGAPLQSVWAKAGVLESHLARRQFGIRSR